MIALHLIFRLRQLVNFTRLKEAVRPWARFVRNRFSPIRRVFSKEFPAVLPPAPPVVIIGYISTANGMGEIARGAITALRAQDHPTAFVDDSGPASIAQEEMPVADPLPEGPKVNIAYLHPRRTRAVTHSLGMPFFRHHFNIAYWAWELPDFPRQWYSEFGPFNEVWTLSAFVQEIIGRIAPIPVLRMWPLIEPANTRRLSRAELGLPEERFIFYYAFDAMSIVERKNPQGFVEAYRRAFGTQSKNTSLVIKMSSGARAMAARAQQGLDPDVIPQLAAQIEAVGGILIDGYLPRATVDSLFATCDCYVSLHRAEGFGLSLAEAMYFGKPTIGTAYSGNLDFMNPMNSFGVGYRLVELEQDFGDFPAGARWAEPDLDHAAARLLEVYENRENAQSIGAQAAIDIRRDFSAQAVGNAMLQRLRVAHI